MYGGIELHSLIVNGKNLSILELKERGSQNQTIIGYTDQVISNFVHHL